jgi:hypothetical protein
VTLARPARRADSSTFTTAWWLAPASA